MSLGPVMLDIEGVELTVQDRHLLTQPAVGGVILFSRNFASREQLSALCEEIHGLRSPGLLIAVDQEGGRVQRFHEGFTRLPSARTIGRQYDLAPASGTSLARAAGYVMARELIDCGLDMSFAPVLDVDRGISAVIGDRAFHRALDVVGELAHAKMSGMKAAGMVAVGKHFPGHGGVSVDSHEALPVDKRMYEDLDDDLQPFARLIRAGLAGIMTAHVLYPDVDSLPASLSRKWLQSVLRERLGFRGAIFSDDLSMGGVAEAGGPAARARAALRAGCDMVLVCNDRNAARDVVQALEEVVLPTSQVRLARMHARRQLALDTPCEQDEQWRRCAAQLASLDEHPNFDLLS